METKVLLPDILLNRELKNHMSCMSPYKYIRVIMGLSSYIQ